jgi:hypothetical protein
MSNGSRHAEQQLVQSLRQHCQQHLADAFDKFQPLCITKLAALASNAESNRLKTLYFDTQRLLRLQGAEIELRAIDTAVESMSLGEHLLGTLVGTSPEILNGTPPTASHSSKSESSTPGSVRGAGDSLKLLEHEDLEVMIALDNCSSQVREELGGEFYELEGRFKSLFQPYSKAGNNSGLPSPIPLSPDALLEAFVGALDDDMIAIEVQLELVKIFAQACFDRAYGEMLNRVIDELAEAGFELLANPDENHSERPDRPQRKPEPNTQSADSIEAKTEPSTNQLDDLHSTRTEADILSQAGLARTAGSETGVEEQRSAYGDESLAMPNSRVQTELLAKISSMLENADQEVQLEAAIGESQASHSGPHSRATATSKGSANRALSRRPCMDKPQLFAEINKHINHLVSHRSELASNGQITRDLSAAMKQLEQGEEGSRLHRNDASVFQVVENTFASFGESMVVAPEVRQVINRCEIPMLKLALKKPLLFEQENHPIRRLFNEMAKYAIGLEQGDCEDNKIYQQMLRLAETMSADSFEERNLPLMLSEFMSIIDRDKRVTSISEKREIERVAVREKVNWARTRVEEEVAKRMVGKNHAQAVIDFVQRSWCLVLHMAHQQKGEVSSDWQVTLKLLDNLLYLASRPASEKDLKYRHELIKHLDLRLGHISTDITQRSLQIEQLTEVLGLNPAPQRTAKITEMAPAAKKWAHKLVKKYRSGSEVEDRLVDEVTQVLMPALKTELPGKNIAQAVQDAETIDSDAQRRLAAMKTGCWIELGGEIKAHKRGKLAGIVGPSWKYVFVDNQGKLIAERDRARLAVDILNGTVTVLDNSYLFDKAIKQAITQIKGLPVAS